MTDKQDRVGDFLRTHKQEIEDSGFSRRVMHRLPDRYDCWATALHLIGCLAGVILFILSDGWDVLTQLIRECDWREEFANIPPAQLSGILLTAVTLLALWFHSLYTRER